MRLHRMSGHRAKRDRPLPDGGFEAAALGKNIVAKPTAGSNYAKTLVENASRKGKDFIFHERALTGRLIPPMNLTAHLQHLEERVLDPAVRNDPAQLGTLLTDDFREFGSSGRSYTKAEILAHLNAEPSATVSLSLSAFAIQLLAPTIALAIYLSTRRDHATGATTQALRSSIWTLQNDTWQMRFHQGTRTSSE
jgi:hypothetical protein